jgi:hypothetical protein
MEALLNYTDARIKKYVEETEEKAKAGAITEEEVEGRTVAAAVIETILDSLKSYGSGNTEAEVVTEEEVEEDEDKGFSYTELFGDTKASEEICRKALDLVIEDPSYISYVSDRQGCCYEIKRSLCIPHIRSYVAELNVRELEKLSMGHLDAAVDIAINTIQKRVDVLVKKRFHLWE